jgi:hypothetical protein
MLNNFKYFVLPLAFAATSLVAQDAAPMPEPKPAPTPTEPAPPTPAPDPDMPPAPDPSPSPGAPPAEPPVPPTEAAAALTPSTATLARDYPPCSALVQDSCINPSEAPATKTKNRRRPHRG